VTRSGKPIWACEASQAELALEHKGVICRGVICTAPFDF
jgi:hypothetical protein